MNSSSMHETFTKHVLHIMHAVQDALSDELRHKKFQGHENKFRGHCYVAAEALWHLLGGEHSGWKPMYVKTPDGESHWFLRHRKTGENLDPTHGQFDLFTAAHNNFTAKGKGFLSKRPSRRAQEVIKRVKEAQRQSSEQQEAPACHRPPPSSSHTKTESSDSNQTSLT